MDWGEVGKVVAGALVGVIGTRIVHRFNVRTNSQYWIAQERWKLKGDLYRRLLEALQALSVDARDISMAEVAIKKGEEAMRINDLDRRDLFQAKQKYLASLDNFIAHGLGLEQSLSTARIWLSDTTTASLELLLAGMTPTKHAGEWGVVLLKQVVDASKQVTNEAKSDLQLGQ